MKNYVWAGFVSFFIFKFIAVLYAIIFGQLDFLCNKEYSAIILFFAILVLPTGSGILGMFLGMLFKILYIPAFSE